MLLGSDRPPIHSSRPNISTRPDANEASSFASVLKGNPNKFNHIVSFPAMVLDDECVVERDLDNFVMGEVKDFSSINNLRVLLSNEGFQQANSGLDSSIPFPPGFTPEREFQHVDAQEVQGMENSLSKRRSKGLSSRVLEDAQPLNVHVSPSINSKKKQVARYWRREAAEQAIQTFFSVLPERHLCCCDSCENCSGNLVNRVQQMKKGSDIWNSRKEAKLFNEWGKLLPTDWESIESY
ncbi:hypothetical protein Tco_1221179 [Tanacetum coccineum]